MRPVSRFAGSQLGNSADYGLNYQCPECGVEAKIWDSGALFMGGVFSLFWGIIGFYAFYSGILWYLFNFFDLDYKDGIDLFLLDFISVLFYLAVVAFSCWTVWENLIKPLKILMQYPVTVENRSKSLEEVCLDKKSKQQALLSFFVYSLFLWVALLGTFWLLDYLGVAIQENEFIKYAAVGVIFSLVFTLNKRYGGNIVYIFVGMVFWLMLFVTAIFTAIPAGNSKNSEDLESLGKPNNSDSPEEDVTTVLIGPDTNEATLGPKSANDSTATSSESIGSDLAGIAGLLLLRLRYNSKCQGCIELQHCLDQ